MSNKDLFFEQSMSLQAMDFSAQRRYNTQLSLYMRGRKPFNHRLSTEPDHPIQAFAAATTIEEVEGVRRKFTDRFSGDPNWLIWYTQASDRVKRSNKRRA